jgi:hypothetical protein
MNKFKLYENNEYLETYTINTPKINEKKVKLYGGIVKDFGNAIVRCHKDYKIFYEGDDMSDSQYDDNTLLQKEMHIFDVGDLIGVVQNYDWDKNLAEFTAEFEFKKKSKVYYGNGCSAYFLLENEKIISLSGEYSCFDDETVNKINKTFNTNYKIIIADI